MVVVVELVPWVIVVVVVVVVELVLLWAVVVVVPVALKAEWMQVVLGGRESPCLLGLGL